MKKQVQKAARFDAWLKDELRKPGERKAYMKVRKAAFLAYRIQCLREDMGLSQADLARRMKTSQQAVSRLESGDYAGFTLKTLENLAEAMGAELVLDFKKRAVKAM